jgi:hypothetical protein
MKQLSPAEIEAIRVPEPKQPFLSAQILSITDAQRDALIKTLMLLESGALVHTPTHTPVPAKTKSSEQFTGHFNMAIWNHTTDCGTICCIGGTAELIGNLRFNIIDRPAALENLFYPRFAPLSTITPAQAAVALRSYLTTGNANWK